MGTKYPFLSLENCFPASYFPLSQELLYQNSLLTPLWNKDWKLKY